ncbi:hypothetical protein ACR04O_03035 [Enterobacter hormaechei]|uniref:hypothetical protein n=1 Tax=Enterobacter hormaechei TaxID=158836 RepID=UPI003F6D058D
MSTTLKEWLLKTIAELEEERDATLGAVNEDAAMALAAMIRAKASLQAEAVYQWRERYEDRDRWDDCSKEQYEGFAKHPDFEIRILYTAPPAPFVPDEINVLQAANLVLTLGVLDNGTPTVAMKVWNACRAAMLQGAEQTNYRAIVERIAEIIHGKVTDIDLLTVTVKSMKDKLQK